MSSSGEESSAAGGGAAPSSSSTSSSSSSTSTSTSTSTPGVQVLDTYPEVSPLLDSGAGELSRAVLAVVQSQVEASTGELQALGRANSLVAAQYAEVKDSVAELGAFYEAHAALALGLQPHLKVLQELERCASGLEEAAKDLDAQTRQLEQVLQSLL